MLLLGAEPHHLLDPCPVVPGPVEQHHFAAAGQVRDVALEIPLSLFGLGGFLQCHDPRTARVQVFHEALDGAALAGGVASFEQNHVTHAGALGPPLQLQQLDLQQTLLALVLATRHALVVWVALAPGLHGIAVLVQQDGIVVVLVVDGVTKIAGREHVEIQLGHDPKLSGRH